MNKAYLLTYYLLTYLNREKTQNIIFSSNVNITEGSSVKLLGVTLDDKLSWSSHVDHLGRKLSSVIFLLRQMKNILSPEIVKTTYFSLFNSHICYATIPWGNSTHAHKIFVLQKKAIRIIASAGKTAIANLYFLLKWA